MPTALLLITALSLVGFLVIVFRLRRTAAVSYDLHIQNFDTLQNIYLSGIQSITPEQCLQLVLEIVSERFHFSFSHVLKIKNADALSFRVWHHVSGRINDDMKCVMDEDSRINGLTREVYVLPLDDEIVNKQRAQFARKNGYRAAVMIPIAIENDVKFCLECFSHENFKLDDNTIIDFFRRLQMLVGPMLQSVIAKQELIQAKHVAQDASRIKTEFLATMSHEIRTPLQGLLGMTKILKEGSDSPQDFRKHATMAFESATALYNVISNVLDYSKIESGRLEIIEKPFNVMDIISGAIDNFSTVARSKNISLTCHFSQHLTSELFGDKQRVWEVVVNLISNAIKFTEKGGIEVYVETTVLDSTRVSLEVRVKDTGIGIPLPMQGRLFKTFVQGEHSVQRKHEGSGLGLSICKSLVELMQGEIDFFSNEQKGSTFWFRVTLKRNHLTVSNELIQTGLVPTFHNSMVLLVEDNEISRYYFEYLLRQMKINFVSCENGEEAIEALQKNDFDAVLLDCHLPKISGFDVARYIRSKVDFGLSKIPIIAITGYAFKDDTTLCNSIGVNDYIYKPILEDDFIKKITHWVSQRKTDSIDVSKLIDDSFVGFMPDKISNSVSDNFDFSLLKKVCEQHVPEERDLIVREVIEAFFKNTPERVKELDEAIKSENFETIWRRSHSIRTSAEIFGAKKLATICRHIEETGRKQQTPSALDSQVLTREFQRLESALKQFLYSPNAFLN